MKSNSSSTSITTIAAIAALAAASIAASSFAAGVDVAEKCGGLVKLSGKGYVSAIDCRRGGDPADWAKGAETVATLFSITVSNFTGTAFSLGNAAAQLRGTGGNVAVFVVDDPALPMSLSAPEERWAMLNAAKAADGNPGRDKLRRRLSLLFARQCCRALGSDESKGEDTCLHSVFDAAGLDAITSFDLPMGVEMAIPDTMTLRGLEKTEWGTYEEACMAGIAAPPTNAVQKAIWDKVHQLPSEPIRIKPEKKKM